MSCMSPYSMPLWTILTKCPAPSGPTCVTHGPASVFAAIASSTSLDARPRLVRSARHERRAEAARPSSPPDTPQPTKWSPLRAQRRLAPARVLEPRVAAVDQDVARARAAARACSIISSTGAPAGNHHHDPARPLERRDQRLERLRAGELRARVVAQELVGPFASRGSRPRPESRAPRCSARGCAPSSRAR